MFGLLPLSESQQFIGRWIRAVHVPMRCRSCGQGDNNGPPASSSSSPFPSPPPPTASPLAKSAGTSLLRKNKLRRALRQNAPLRSHSRSRRGCCYCFCCCCCSASLRTAAAMMKRNGSAIGAAVFTVHSPPSAATPSSRPSLTPHQWCISIRHSVFFSSFLLEALRSKKHH